jgi:hypothetical protein
MKKFIRDFAKEFMIAARETPRLYFAIFVGAYKGINAELDAIQNRQTA